LSLWLKTARLDEALSGLDHAIKCGNSLIDDVSVAGEKAFVWEKEFKTVMDKGGFDVVVGNPPYVFARDNKFSDSDKKYYYAHYSQAKYQINTYVLFTELAYWLLKPSGYNGFIVPNTWLTISSFVNFRKFILEETNETKIVNIFEKVFEEANVDCSVLSYRKAKGGTSFAYGTFEGKDTTVLTYDTSLMIENDYIIGLSHEAGIATLLKKIEQNSVQLKEVATVSTGLKAYQVGKGKPQQTEKIKFNRSFHSDKKINETYIKYVEGRDVQRYAQQWSGEYLSYGEWLAEPRKSINFATARILVRQIPSSLPHSINAVFTKEALLNDINSMVIQGQEPCLLVILPIINSRAISFWFAHKFGKLQRGLFPQFKINELEIFPIAKTTKENNNSLITLATLMLDKNRDLQALSTRFLTLLKAKHRLEKLSKALENWYLLENADFLAELAKKKITLNLKQETQWLAHFNEERVKAIALKNEIDATDREIDSLVYALYDLTPDEIAVIEAKND
jgi:hypothetical protein